MFFHSISDFLRMIDKFLRHLKRNNYSEETVVAYSKDLKKFYTFLKETHGEQLIITDITKEDILDFQDFLVHKGFAKNSVARHISCIKSFFNFLYNELGITNNPGSKVRTPKVFTPLSKILTVDEIEQYMSVAKSYSTYYFVLISCLYYTGSRITPVIQLLKENVDLQAQKVYFPKIKGGKDLYLPLHPKLSKILMEFIYTYRPNSDYVFPSPKQMNKPISVSDVRVNMKEIQKLSKIETRITPHVIRHCTATHLTLNGVDQRYLASILGHSDLRSTMRYQHLNVENLRNSIEFLE